MKIDEDTLKDTTLRYMNDVLVEDLNRLTTRIREAAEDIQQQIQRQKEERRFVRMMLAGILLFQMLMIVVILWWRW